MTDFERQIGTVLGDMGGPEPRFDAMEIVRAATNHHPAIVTGRTRSMFSPAQALTVGALVFALGGALLVAQPFDQQGGAAPGAAAPDVELTRPVEFTGSIVCGPDARTGMADIPLSGGDTSVTHSRGWAWQPSATMSEPRLEGTYYYAYDSDEYRTEGLTSIPSVGSGTWRIENDEGAWQGSHPNIGFADGTYSKATTILIGEGAYEGLTAIWEGQHDGPACTWDIRGLIIEGNVPAAPEPFRAE
jgi:hypothetical protein